MIVNQYSVSWRKMEKIRDISFMQILAIFLTSFLVVGFLLFFLLYISRVDIGERMARESYTNDSDWLWNVGIFTGAMSGFGLLFSFFYDFSFFLFDSSKEMPKRFINSFRNILFDLATYLKSLYSIKKKRKPWQP